VSAPISRRDRLVERETAVDPPRAVPGGRVLNGEPRELLDERFLHVEGKQYRI